MTEQLLEKYIRGETSREERCEVAEWIEASPDHRKEYIRLHRLHDMTLWQENIGQSRWTLFSKQRKMLKPLVVELLKVAAVALVVYGGVKWGTFRTVKNPVTMQTVHVPVGQRAEVTLADGSKVWLNSKTTLTYPSAFDEGERRVELDGEGFFSVAHNENKPFVVNTERHKVKVLGTQFNVFAYHGSKHFETSLVNGSVQVYDDKKGESCILEPMQRASDRNGGLTVSEINGEYFQWTEGLICFDDEPLEELFEKLQIYYNVTFKIENSALLTERYSGKFSLHDGVEHILRTLQLRSRFNYETTEEDENYYVIR